MRRLGGWLFRDRSTGEIVVGQWPNRPLWLFLFASGMRQFVHPRGTAGTVVSVVATVGLAWWAIDEVARGVNPFRRILGGFVSIGVVAGLLFR